MLPALDPEAFVTAPGRPSDSDLPSQTSDDISPNAPHHPRSAINTGRWSAEEDTRLREAVARSGTRWVAVAAYVGTRNAEQCAKRWNDNVNPDLDHSFWSAEEDKLLLTLVTVYGHNWKLMAEGFLSARAPLAIKNRHSLLMRRQKRQKAKQQHPSTTSSRDRVLPTISPRYTPPSGPHPPCRLDVVSIESASFGSSSSSPFSVQSHASAASASPIDSGVALTPSHHRTDVPEGGALTRLDYTMDLSDLLLAHGTGEQGNNTMWNNSAIPPAGDSPSSQNRHVGHSRWNGHGLNNGFDLGSLLGNVDLSLRPGEADDGIRGPDGGTHIGDGSDKGIEFSVTCSRSKLKAMVCHAFEGAMSETAELSEEEPVTVTLRLRR